MEKEKIKITYDGKDIFMIPFDDKNLEITEFKEYLLGYLDSFTREFEIDIEINYETKKINAKLNSSDRKYAFFLEDSLLDSLVYTMEVIFGEEKIIIPTEECILYDDSPENSLYEED